LTEIGQQYDSINEFVTAAMAHNTVTERALRVV
jgi:hypothetical protein